MIDALAEETRKKGRIGGANLTLLTTSDTYIANDIKEYTLNNNIGLFQSIAGIDGEGNFIMSDPEFIGYQPAGYLINKAKDAINFDKFDTYDPITPTNHTEGITSGSFPGDPDKACSDDKNNQQCE